LLEVEEALGLFFVGGLRGIQAGVGVLYPSRDFFCPGGHFGGVEEARLLNADFDENVNGLD